MFPDSTNKLQTFFDGDPLPNGTIFFSKGAGIKSIDNLKLKDFFHIKKKEEDIYFGTYFHNSKQKFLRKKF